MAFAVGSWVEEVFQSMVASGILRENGTIQGVYARGQSLLARPGS